MRILIVILVIMVLSFAACLLLPWWSIALVSFITILAIPLRPLPSFISGFAAVFFLWLILAWWISAANNHILAHKVSLLIIKADSPTLLILITAFIGGLVAGFASLAAGFLKLDKVESM